MRFKLLSILLASVLLLGTIILPTGVYAADETDWNLANYEFDSSTLPADTINEGTIAGGKMTFTGTKSFYTAASPEVVTKMYSEISLRVTAGAVNICFTNKISAQGYRVHVTAEGNVSLIGGPSLANLGTIGTYNPANLCKIAFEMDLEEDVIRVSVDGATAKEYLASTAAYYTSNNANAKGYSRVLIAGHSAESTVEVDYVKVTSNSLPEPPPAIEDDDFTGTRITCCGDSITEGVAASGPSKSYPSQLQNLLGDKYLVKNFGIGGASAIGGGSLCYKYTEQYRNALLSKPDVVILMLGMNDANPTHSWNLPSGEIGEDNLKEYKKNMLELIESFEKLESKPQIFLVTTTPMTRTAGPTFSESYVTNFNANLNELRKLQKEIAKEKGLFLIDGEAPLTEANYFADGCHLSDVGYGVLAGAIGDVILENVPDTGDGILAAAGCAAVLATGVVLTKKKKKSSEK
ncbi:MAG: hypothetical protein E7630_01395 [Ruminococcaceae bacterium]|nr:hypothetical protein [Oscillospiraceae bacterium]